VRPPPGLRSNVADLVARKFGSSDEEDDDSDDGCMRSRPSPRGGQAAPRPRLVLESGGND
jgi:hypothetical protein